MIRHFCDLCNVEMSEHATRCRLKTAAQPGESRVAQNSSYGTLPVRFNSPMGLLDANVEYNEVCATCMKLILSLVQRIVDKTMTNSIVDLINQG